MTDVMNLKNISHHYHEVEALLMHAHENEKETAYYVLVSYDKNEKEIKKSSFLNFTKDYKEAYQQKSDAFDENNEEEFFERIGWESTEGDDIEENLFK